MQKFQSIKEIATILIATITSETMQITRSYAYEVTTGIAVACCGIIS